MFGKWKYSVLSHFDFFSEKPHDVEWNELEKQKIPILLNFAQCKLLEGDYYAVIEHCNSVITSDKGKFYLVLIIWINISNFI